LESSGQSDLKLALSGLQAGCLGSILMIGWWLLAETLQRYSTWLLPNLLATTFYGERAYGAGFATSTWSGLAFPFVVYCAAGAAFAVVGRERKASVRLILVGVVTGVALDWLFFGVALRHFNPMVHIYSPDQLILVSHLLYGITLASYPLFLEKMKPAAVTGSDQQVGGSVAQRHAEPPPIPLPLQEATTVPGTSADEDARR
jgi:hypothetical protein